MSYLLIDLEFIGKLLLIQIMKSSLTDLYLVFDRKRPERYLFSLLAADALAADLSSLPRIVFPLLLVVFFAVLLFTADLLLVAGLLLADLDAFFTILRRR